MATTFVLSAGILLGIFMVLLRLSGHAGPSAVMVVLLVELVMMAPLGLRDLGSLAAVSRPLFCVAALVGGAGLVLLSMGLGRAKEVEIGTLIVIMIVAQLAAPAVWDAYQNGIQVGKVIGVLLGIMSVVLVMR